MYLHFFYCYLVMVISVSPLHVIFSVPLRALDQLIYTFLLILTSIVGGGSPSHLPNPQKSSTVSKFIR